MAKARGRQVGRRAVDMTIRPQVEEYCPPPPEECESFTYPIYPEDGNTTDRLIVRLQVHRGLVVDFAISQSTRVEGQWVKVARIDCCHGVVHRHQFDRRGNDIYDRRPIKAIPQDNPWEVINGIYDEALRMMENEYDENLRRWRGGRS